MIWISSSFTKEVLLTLYRVELTMIICCFLHSVIQVPDIALNIWILSDDFLGFRRLFEKFESIGENVCSDHLFDIDNVV